MGVKDTPAFPSHGSMGEVAQQGMTLRDYFAARAMQAQITYLEQVMPKHVAYRAYQLADAMLQERDK